MTGDNEHNSTGTDRHPAEKAYDEVLDELAGCDGFPLAEEAALRMRNRWMNTTTKQVETEMVDPEAPVRFVRLVVDGEEQAMIPWDEAEAIAEQVEQHNETGSEWLIHRFECPDCNQISRADRAVKCFQCGSQMKQVERIGEVYDSVDTDSE
jgi:ribosomal protein S27E